MSQIKTNQGRYANTSVKKNQCQNMKQNCRLTGEQEEDTGGFV